MGLRKLQGRCERRDRKMRGSLHCGGKSAASPPQPAKLSGGPASGRDDASFGMDG
jgi:hypothetical protein